MLVVGWHGKPSTHIFNIGSTVDPIIEQAPCDIVVMKDCGGNKKFEKIVVPIAGGPNSAMAMEIASIVAEEDSKITVITVDNGRLEFDLDSFVRETAVKLKISADRFETKRVKSKSTVLGILRTAKHYDLVVMGTSNKPLVSQLMKVSLPEKIARRCKTPMIITKSGKGVRSWIKWWI